MDNREAFDRIVESFHEAMLDDRRWPSTSARIDDACGLTGSGLLFVDGTKDARMCPLGLYYRGEPRRELEREYLEKYHRSDERVPRFRRLADRRLVETSELYTADERKTSPTYNEMLARAGMQNGLNARLKVENGSIAWGIGDPIDTIGWSSGRIGLIAGLLTHIQQFVRVRQALAGAEATRCTATTVLENPRIGVVHLDRHGRIITANDRGRDILKRGDGLTDRRGMLRTRRPGDQARLDGVLNDALPGSNATPVSRSMLLRRSPVLPPFVVHVKPVTIAERDYGAQTVAALVLIVEPGRQWVVEPDVVASTLELTATESRIAVWLADGRSVEQIAEATQHSKGSVYWHLNQIYRKQSISGQVDLVRLVLSLADFE